MASKVPSKPKVVAKPKPVTAAPKTEAVKAAPVVETPVAETPVVPEVAVEIAPAVDPVPVEEPVIQAAIAAPVAAETAIPLEKEIIKMATAFETPKAFTEFNDRAKAAVEKSTKFVEEFNDFAKGNVEAAVESGKIAAKGFESLGQDAAAYSRKSFEGFTATLKTLATVKSPADFFKLQSDYVRSSFDSAVAEASKGTEALIKLTSDAAQPISNRFAVAVEKAKTAA